MTDARVRVRQLYRQRPRNWFLRMNAAVVAVLLVVAWLQLDVRWSDLVAPRRLENIRRFASELYPFALRGEPFRLGAWWDWFRQIWDDHAREATASTFSIAVAAIILAGAAAAAAALPGARNLATPDPFLPGGRRPSAARRWGWAVAVGSVRSVLIVARAVPEFIWAFLLVALLGPSAWPAILALALHNFGILGKLGAETIENADPAVPQALRAQGLSRAQIGLVGLVPMAMAKWLLFFFYRWETCIREATVLGLLGIASLGFWVQESRVRGQYDQMLVYILLGALLVLACDLISALTRRYVRRG